MDKDREILTPAERLKFKDFGLSVYLSGSPDAELVGISTQSHNDQMEVVEVAYFLAPQNGRDNQQPSVWTWKKASLGTAKPLRIHASTHIVNHSPAFRAGTWIPSTEEMDDLGDGIDVAAMSETIVNIDGKATTAGTISLNGWGFLLLDAGDSIVSVAGSDELGGDYLTVGAQTL